MTHRYSLCWRTRLSTCVNELFSFSHHLTVEQVQPMLITSRGLFPRMFSSTYSSPTAFIRQACAFLVLYSYRQHCFLRCSPRPGLLLLVLLSYVLERARVIFRLLPSILHLGRFYRDINSCFMLIKHTCVRKRLYRFFSSHRFDFARNHASCSHLTNYLFARYWS
jgi:hypothetical protein